MACSLGGNLSTQEALHMSSTNKFSVKGFQLPVGLDNSWLVVWSMSVTCEWWSEVSKQAGGYPSIVLSRIWAQVTCPRLEKKRGIEHWPCMKSEFRSIFLLYIPATDAPVDRTLDVRQAIKPVQKKSIPFPFILATWTSLIFLKAWRIMVFPLIQLQVFLP